MDVYRIEVQSWTSSFRYPNIISGYQPTLLVPPISTILGMINACAGQYLDFSNESIGYYFENKGKGIDLETIYQININDKTGTIGNTVEKTNVIHREFLYDCRLFIYLTNSKFIKYFKTPFFPIMLGRSNDLASICDISKCSLEKKHNADHIRGQIVPISEKVFCGTIQALPQYFTNTLPRQNLGMQAYSIIPFDCDPEESTATAYRDYIDGEIIDIYFHNLNFGTK